MYSDEVSADILADAEIDPVANALADPDTDADADPDTDADADADGPGELADLSCCKYRSNPSSITE
jgi:hypothetical protein